MTPKAARELLAIHEAAHAVVAARLGWDFGGMKFGKMAGYADMSPRRYSRKADILIGLAGHAAELRAASLKPRYRHNAANPYKSIGQDLTSVFALLAQGGRADTIFPRFRSAFAQVDAILAEPRTWAAVMNVAAVLLRRGKISAAEFAPLVAKLRTRT